MSIYFGSVNQIQNRIHHIVDQEYTKHILIVATGINFIDLSGAEMLANEARRLKGMGGGLYFAELKSSVYEFISRNYLVAKIGNSHFFDTKREAIASIFKKLDSEQCAQCPVRVFKECNW